MVKDASAHSELLTRARQQCRQPMVFVYVGQDLQMFVSVCTDRDDTMHLCPAYWAVSLQMQWANFRGNQESLSATKECPVIEFQMNTSCFLASGPPSFFFTIYCSLWITECMLTQMLTVQRQVGVCASVCVCVARGKREGRFLLCISSAQWLSKLPHLFRLLSPSLPFLSPCSPVPVLSVSCVTFFFLSFCLSSCHRRTRSSLSGVISWSHRVSHSPALNPFPSLFFLLYFLDFFFGLLLLPLLLLLLHHSCCILHLLLGCCRCIRDQQQTEVGVSKSIIDRSGATCLWHLSHSLSSYLSPLSPSASCHFALSVRVGMIVLVCSYRATNARQTVGSTHVE